jgi:hypothetical protein
VSLETGAAWVFTRSGAAWSQQGPKLVGAGAAGGNRYSQIKKAYSVALSADGIIATLGGPLDNPTAQYQFTGAMWVFARIGDVWTQQGSKLVGTGANGSAEQGASQGGSIALSGDGNTFIVGGPEDNSRIGGAWVFSR